MARRASDRTSSGLTDREFYADLWGVKSRAARTRDAWSDVHKRSGLLLLFATAALAVYALITTLIGGSPDSELPTGEDDPTELRSTVGSEIAVSGTPTELVAGDPLGPTQSRGPQDGATIAESGASNTPSRPATSVPIPVIFDTDAVNGVEDTLALAMLHTYASMGTVNLLAVTISQADPSAAPYIDAIDSYYGAPDVPIGVIRDGGYTSDVSYFHRQIAADTYRFPHDLTDGAQAEDATALLRRQLAAQPDGSVVVVAVGFSTNLVRLLDSPPDGFSELNGTDLVARKVRLLANTAGEFSRRQPEFHVAKDPRSAEELFKRWPTTIVTSQWQVGADLPFPGEALSTMPAEPANPVLEAFALHGNNALQVGFPYHQPAFDSTAMLYAIEPEADYFTVGEPGAITVDRRALTTFTPGGHSRHYLLQAPSTAADTKRTIDRIVTLVTGASSDPS